MLVNARRITLAIFIAGIVLAFAKFIFIDNKLIDILIAVISTIDGPSTVYAEGYSESRFRSLRVGMTARQVEEIMGPPLEKGRWQVPGGSGPVTPGEGLLDELWYYARAAKAGGNHWRREVWFRDGVIDGTESTYYLD